MESRRYCTTAFEYVNSVNVLYRGDTAIVFKIIFLAHYFLCWLKKYCELMKNRSINSFSEMFLQYDFIVDTQLNYWNTWWYYLLKFPFILHLYVNLVLAAASFCNEHFRDYDYSRLLSPLLIKGFYLIFIQISFVIVLVVCI